MNAKLTDMPSTWVDPDDAPELGDAFFANGTWMVGDKPVPKDEGMAAMRSVVRGRPVGSAKKDTKQAVTVRYSPDVLAAFRAMGAGWQAKMDDALREWLRAHTSA